MSFAQQSNFYKLQFPSCFTKELPLSQTESPIMALNVNAVTDLVEGLSITDKTSKVDGQVPSSPLRDAIQLLDQSAKTTSSQAEQASILAGSSIHRNNLDIAEISSLCRIASEVTETTRILADTATTLRGAAERSIIAFLVSLGRQGGADVRDGSLIQRMLSHFNKKIRSIVRCVLSKSGDENCVPWKIAEECYNQACSGELQSDNYFIPRDEALLGWRYDSDYEAEEYYEHEERLAVDEGYAKTMGERMERRREEREREKQSWISFWVLVLHGCPDGPTLFYPPASSEIKLQMPTTRDTPRYLFRTFDKNSSGTSNDNIVASRASVKLPKESRKDLMSLPTGKAIKMLHTHLKPLDDGKDSDNLMSWTSSLLFAIQYAIYRRHTLGCHAANIKICVVDTRRFPQGQFAPDMQLLQAYLNTPAQVNWTAEKFFRFRLEYTGYYNGEYLSQGSVDHAGRSCVVSLETLEKSGLYKLYPEFKHGTDRWAKRALELRQGWSSEQRTTHREIKLALDMARKCFKGIETLLMMLMLLTFKSRQIKGKSLLYSIVIAFVLDEVC